MKSVNLIVSGLFVNGTIKIGSDDVLKFKLNAV